MRKFLFACLFLIGCDDSSSGLDGYDESPGTVEDLRHWIPSASAPAVYGQALAPIMVASLDAEGDTCPVITEGADGTTYEGGCVDMEGEEWLGRAESSSSVGTAGTIVLDGFGFVGESDDCPGMVTTTTWHGTIDQTPSGFVIDVRVEIAGPDDTCTERAESMAIEYSGSVEMQGENVSVFSGSGRLGSSRLGAVSVSTDREMLDSSTCNEEALSGTTTIEASGHTAVVTYDGATDCDETSTVTWTYDGEDQGELSGVSCRAGGGASGVVSALLVLAALFSLNTRRSQ